VSGTFFVYLFKLKYMNKITNFLTALLFGERVEGEPVNFNQSLPPERSGEGFFEWCSEYRVGCCTHNKPTFY
jgi:hypothetical protein